MRITLTFDSVPVADLPAVLDCIAEGTDLTATSAHCKYPPSETREAIVTRCGWEHYTVDKGPISPEHAVRIMDGIRVWVEYKALEQACNEVTP